MKENELLTSKQVAKILGVSSSLVPVLVRRGHFPGARKLDGTRLNSPLRIPRADVVAYQEKQLVLSKSNE